MEHQPFRVVLYLQPICITDVIEPGGQVNVIFTDSRNALVTVDPNILFRELDIIGFRDPLLSWFKSNTDSRHRLLKVLNSTSVLTNITSGVPRGWSSESTSLRFVCRFY